MTINDILLYRTYEIPTKNRGKQGKKDKSLFKGNRRGCKHNKGGKHMSRKTFASTVLLYNDVPIEIVSELLGHSNMGIVISGIINELIIIRGKCIPSVDKMSFFTIRHLILFQIGKKSLIFSLRLFSD